MGEAADREVGDGELLKGGRSGFRPTPPAFLSRDGWCVSSMLGPGDATLDRKTQVLLIEGHSQVGRQVIVH